MRCGAHPERVATAECVVCGQRACEECSPVLAALQGPVCAACRPSVLASTAASSTPAPDSGRGLLWVTAAALAVGCGVVVWSQTSRSVQETEDTRMQSAFAALSATGTAAERHRGSAGEWPQSLDELVPSQLSALPQDPFGDMQTLRLAPDPSRPDGLVIYSLGPDGVDHGGRPRDPVTGLGDLVYPLD